MWSWSLGRVVQGHSPNVSVIDDAPLRFEVTFREVFGAVARCAAHRLGGVGQPGGFWLAMCANHGGNSTASWLLYALPKKLKADVDSSHTAADNNHS